MPEDGVVNRCISFTRRKLGGLAGSSCDTRISFRHVGLDLNKSSSRAFRDKTSSYRVTLAFHQIPLAEARREALMASQAGGMIEKLRLDRKLPPQP